MLKIRKGVFETNSSSVHTLTVRKELNPDEDILKLTKEIIYPFAEKELKELQYSDDLYVFTSIRDKLRYIWTCAIQANELDKGYKLLKEIFPHVDFIYKPCEYIFEDCECLFDSYSEDYTKWSLDQWKKWFVAGDVIVYNRDMYDRDGTLSKYDESLIENKVVQEGYKRESDKEHYDAISWEG